jgi:ATP-binding cassette subfamily B protein
MFIRPIRVLGMQYNILFRAMASAERIFQALDWHETIREPAVSATLPERVEGRIEFRNLTFAYNGQPILRDIDLTIEPGQTVGVVGSTGSGKTTLVSLVPRLYRVPRGQLFIDGRDVNDWDVESLRQQVGFAAQEPFLFSATVADNIRFGIDDAPMSAVKELADVAALAKDVEAFPRGYETMVGEGGSTLSGGEKQRIAIARAVLKDAPIVLLDEATASLDPENELYIQQAIDGLVKDKTVVIIAHRLNTVVNADKIVVLDEGKIVEEGKHDDLLKNAGLYASMWNEQDMVRSWKFSQ